MKHLILIRHAQALDPLPHQKDFDRSLSARGIAAAIEQAKLIDFKGYSGVYHSASRRTTETAMHFAKGNAQLTLHPRKDLYNADLNQLIEVIEELWTEEAVVIVAHNPGITQLFFHLTGIWEPFETCSVAQLQFKENTVVENLEAAAHCIQLLHSKI